MAGNHVFVGTRAPTPVPGEGDSERSPGSISQRFSTHRANGRIDTMKTTKIMGRDGWVTLILGSGLLFGIVLRAAPGLMAGFPVYDGGMFLRMIQDLGANHYNLPVTTSYNLLDNTLCISALRILHRPHYF